MTAFRDACARLGLRVEEHPGLGPVGWWDAATRGAVLLRVRYDEPLAVTAACAALDLLRDRGWSPSRPVGLLLVDGSADVQEASEDGVAASVRLQLDPGSGPRVTGRYRVEVAAAGAHPGAAPDPVLPDPVLSDPVLTFAVTALAADKQARLVGARAGFGRVELRPNTAGTVAHQVTGWLDVRAAAVGELHTLVEAVTRLATDRAARDGTVVRVAAEEVVLALPDPHAAPESVAATISRLAGAIRS